MSTAIQRAPLSRACYLGTAHPRHGGSPGPGAEIGFPAGDEALLPLRQRVLDWMLAPAFLKPPSTDTFETRGTYTDWGPLHRKKGNPHVTIDALYVLREAGRGW